MHSNKTRENHIYQGGHDKLDQMKGHINSSRISTEIEKICRLLSNIFFVSFWDWIV